MNKVSDYQRIAIIGLGYVGRAIASAMIHRNSCLELCLIDIKKGLEKSLAKDFSTAACVDSLVKVHAGDYQDILGAQIIIIDAGVNEMEGGATDRNDPQGRLGLIDSNLAVLTNIASHLNGKAKDSIVIVVTNPPDPLADFLRNRISAKQVLSSGTFLDTMRLRGEISQALNVSTSAVDAMVIGEHGTSSVINWSTAQVGGIPFIDYVLQQELDPQTMQTQIEQRVREANLDIIQGLGASQYGIGAMVARIAEAILHDERIIMPVGCLNAEAGVTFSLPSIIGAGGVQKVLTPSLDGNEKEGLQKSITALLGAKDRVEQASLASS